MGTALTRICMRHRSMENRLQTLATSLVESLALGVNNSLEAWRGQTSELDKAHRADYKRSTADIKRRSTDTIRLRKKAKKGESTLSAQAESTQQEVSDRCLVLLDEERRYVRRALLTQRSQLCSFLGTFLPVLDGELSLLAEVDQMNEVVQKLLSLSADPHNLPEASENLISDVQGLDTNAAAYTSLLAPSSPSNSSNGLGSRVPSFASLSSTGSDGRRSAQRSSFYQHQYSHISDRDSQEPIYGQSRKPLSGHSNSDEEAHSTPSMEGPPDFSTPSPSPGSQWDTISRTSSRISAVYTTPTTVARPSNLGLSASSAPPPPPSAFHSRAQPPSGKRTAASTPLATPTATASLPQALPPQIPDFHSQQPDQIHPPSVVFRQASAPAASLGRRHRPSSFVGEADDLQRLLEETGFYASSRNSIAGYPTALLQQQGGTASATSQQQPNHHQESGERKTKMPPPPPPKPKGLGRGGGAGMRRGGGTLPRSFLRPNASADSALLPTLTENFPLAADTGGQGAESRSGTLTRRHSMSGKPPPPPPQRRNSQLSAGTPVAVAPPMAMPHTPANAKNHSASPAHRLPASDSLNAFDLAHETFLMQIRNGASDLHSPTETITRDPSTHNIRF